MEDYGWKKHAAKEEPSPSWTQGQAKQELDRLIGDIVNAERGPQAYTAQEERLEIALHKQAQGAVLKAGLTTDASQAYRIVEEKLAGAREIEAVGKGR